MRNNISLEGFVEDRKRSVILIGLGFISLSPRRISQISGSSIGEVKKIKSQNVEFLLENMYRYKKAMNDLIEGNEDFHDGIVESYWDEYCLSFSGLTNEEVIDWFNKYAEHAMEELKLPEYLKRK